MKKLIKKVLFVIFLAISTHAFSAPQALLIGVGQYQNPSFNLEGPKNDVLALEQVLIEKWGFNKNTVTKLVDAQASHDEIIKALKSIKAKTQSGDQVYIYFSGHGTSRLDREMQMPLPYGSGAFIPADFPITYGTTEERYAKLIVGRRDLRPILKDLDDSGRSVLVVYDSCYSGNAVRGLFGKDELPSRYMAIPTKGMSSYGLDDDELVEYEIMSKEDERYPYKNVYFISAASDAEKAADIPSRWLKRYPTFDGKPHGAFTNALLGILTGKVKSDFNHDGIVVYAELSRAVKDVLKEGHFKQHPQTLPQMKDDMTLLAMRSVLGVNRPLATAVVSPPAVKYVPLRVLLESNNTVLFDRLSKISKVQLVTEHANLVIRQQGMDYLLLSGRFDLIGTLRNPSIETLIGRVHQALWQKELKTALTAHASFNMALSRSESKKGLVAKAGELIAFTLRSERPIYLLLLDIDSNGQLNILYPYTKSELAPIAANKVVFIPGELPGQKIKVQAPFGTDHLIAIGFSQLPESLPKLLGASTLLEGAEQFNLVNALLKSKQYTYGFAEFDLITLPK
jgi:hypothetical protein